MGHPTGPSLDGPVHPTGLGPIEFALSRTSLDATGSSLLMVLFTQPDSVLLNQCILDATGPSLFTRSGLSLFIGSGAHILGITFSSELRFY